MHYFITSVSWRHLYLDLLDFVQNDVVGLDALECLIESEQLMRDYLLGKRAEIGNIEHHIFFFEDIDTISDELKELQRLQKAADKIEKYPIWDDFKKDREL